MPSRAPDPFDQYTFVPSVAMNSGVVSPAASVVTAPPKRGTEITESGMVAYTLLASTAMAVGVSMLASVKAWHLPAEHVPPWQSWPQAPQSVALALVFVSHASSAWLAVGVVQSALPLWHVGRHAPASHLRVATPADEQACAHAPQ